MRLRSSLLCCVLVAMAAGGHIAGAQDITAGTSCMAVLQQGVYNTLQTTQSSSSYYNAHQAACQDYSDYTYDMYKLDTSSSEASGRAASFNAAVKAFFWGVSVGGSSSSYFSSSQSFSEAKTKAAAYRASACGSSSVTSAYDSSVSILQRFLEPNAYAAYTACLQLYASGVRIRLTSSFDDARSFAVSIQFVAGVYGAAANLTAIQLYGPPGAAGCKVLGPTSSASGRRRATEEARILADAVAKPPPPSPPKRQPPPSPPRPPPPSPPRQPPPSPPTNAFQPGVQGTFPLVLYPNIIYSVFCQLDPSKTPADGGYTTVYIFTTAAQPFTARLYHAAPRSQVDAMQAQVDKLQSQVAALQTQTTQLTAQLASQQTTSQAAMKAQVETLQSQVAALQMQTAQLATQQATPPQAAMQGQVDKLQSQVVGLQTQMTSQQTAQTSTQQQLAALQKQLESTFTGGLWAKNKKFFLVMQDDGNLVLYNNTLAPQTSPMWATSWFNEVLNPDKDTTINTRRICIGGVHCLSAVGSNGETLMLSNKAGTRTMLMVSSNPYAKDRLIVYQNADGREPYFYINNGYPGYGVWRG